MGEEASFRILNRRGAWEEKELHRFYFPLIELDRLVWHRRREEK